ncbi:restriction endonuclease subunit S [Anaerovibrio sp.]|uniref:restriction endonuclease subunit S n=1 Tax=Anaerovibrio sp. TaxID=1872532 RepID=UPI0025BD5C99|nr:restriction endonuclease subunit S [Anaerovibrio sp.]MBR2143560.1 restriction endonuclease subunit S [Anaerovibrio sp.]
MMHEMKDCEIKWIGEIPAEWELNKIKYIAVLKGRIGWQGLTSEEYTDEGAYLITGTDFENGGINWNSCVHVPMKRWEEARDIQIENGDLLITKDGTIGKVAIVSGCDAPTSLNSGVLRISLADGYDRRFLFWVLQSEVFWTWFTDKNAGNSTIQHLYQGDFAEFKYAIPPLAEQQAIATFLDVKCAKLDSIIADLERQIEIWNNYRMSIITEAVTKGIRKDVKMKPCDKIWQDGTPSHWKVKRLKYICDYITDGSHLSPETTYDGIPYITAADVHGVGINYDMAKKISLADFKALEKTGCRPQCNDVLLVKDGATTGRIGFVVSDELCVILSSVAILRGNALMNNKYLMYLMESEFMQSQIFVSMAGSAMPRTILAKIVNYYGLLCPLKEQAEIVEYLDKKCVQIKKSWRKRSLN